MIVRENHKIIIDTYPFADSIKDHIIADSTKFPFVREKYNGDGGLTNVRAFQTDVIKSFDNFSSVKLLFRWILQLLPDGANIEIGIEEFWIANYGQGDFTVNHHHHPCLYSFVYFVQSPKGSSPLVFTTSGRRIKPDEGKLVLFPASVLHHVPKNRCDDRIVLAGNLRWLYYSSQGPGSMARSQVK